MWSWLQDKLGITVSFQMLRSISSDVRGLRSYIGAVHMDLLRTLDEKEHNMQVDRSKLTAMLVSIKQSSDSIADLIARLRQAADAGAQNEVNALVAELAPAEGFLRALASDPTPEAVESDGVVPAMPPVAGLPVPSEDPDVAAEVQEQMGNTPNAGTPGVMEEGTDPAVDQMPGESPSSTS